VAEAPEIAADHFPDVRVLATGSSTLEASAKFRNALVGRREVVWLTPMVSLDLVDFGSRDLVRRLERGGLPPFFLAENGVERYGSEMVEFTGLEELVRTLQATLWGGDPDTGS
jgi:predicted AAA+ superfamily ATPase